jgi:hypothetical protein
VYSQLLAELEAVFSIHNLRTRYAVISRGMWLRIGASEGLL